MYFGSHPLFDQGNLERFFNIATYGIYRKLTHGKIGPNLRENFAVDVSLYKTVLTKFTKLSGFGIPNPDLDQIRRGER